MKTLIKYCREAWDVVDIYEYDLDTTVKEIRKGVFDEVYKRLSNYLKKNNKK